MQIAHTCSSRVYTSLSTSDKVASLGLFCLNDMYLGIGRM